MQHQMWWGSVGTDSADFLCSILLTPLFIFVILVIRMGFGYVFSLGHRFVKNFEIIALGNLSLCISVLLGSFERSYLEKVHKSIPLHFCE